MSERFVFLACIASFTGSRSQFASLRPSQFTPLPARRDDPPPHRRGRLNACQCWLLARFSRFGGVVGVRRATASPSSSKAHRSPPGIIVTVHVSDYFLVLVVGFVILVTGVSSLRVLLPEMFFFRLSVSLRPKIVSFSTACGVPIVLRCRLVRPCIGFHLSAYGPQFPRFVEAAHHPFCQMMSGCPIVAIPLA